MPTLPYYDIPLVNDGTQDFAPLLNAILARIVTMVAHNQLPVGTTLRWGDITNGKFLACSGSGVQLSGDMNFAQNEAVAFVIQRGSSFPLNPVEGQLFFRSTVGLYQYLNGGWVKLAASVLDALSAVFGARGELVAGSAAGANVIVSAPLNRQILQGDPAAPGGMRWVDASELDVPALNANIAAYATHYAASTFI